MKIDRRSDKRFGCLGWMASSVLLSRFFMKRYRISNIEKRAKEYQIEAMEKVKAMENDIWINQWL